MFTHKPRPQHADSIYAITALYLCVQMAVRTHHFEVHHWREQKPPGELKDLMANSSQPVVLQVTCTAMCLLLKYTSHAS